MAARSMTGFARVRGSGSAGDLTITLKSVNHRALDIHPHAPPEFDMYEPALRGLVRKYVSRGHVDVRIAFVPAQIPDCAGLNRPLFDAYRAALGQVRELYGLESSVDVNSALRIPGMLLARNSPEEEVSEMEPLLMKSLEEALDVLNRFREREGAALVEVMLASNAAIRADAEDMQSKREQVLPALRERTAQRLGEILAGVPLDPQRVAQEAILLVDRSDIAEELARLMVHTSALERLLQSGGEVGKKLDFLLQEMNRESTTVLSKTSGLGELGLSITERALDAKSHIERIREQALNLE